MQINSPELKPTSINYWGKVTRADGVGGGGGGGWRNNATAQRGNDVTDDSGMNMQMSTDM